MPVVPPRWCGMAVHQAQRTACCRQVTEDGQVPPEVRECATTYSALRALRDGLHAQPCPVVALESTGGEWRPVSQVLAGPVEVFGGQAHEMRRRPGRQTAKAEARWMAARLAHGLMRPRCLPPPTIQALRERPRPRVALVQTRSQAKNRLPKV
jgi:transposase